MKMTALIAGLLVFSSALVAQETTLTTKPKDLIVEPAKPAPNEVITEKARYSGVLVQCAKGNAVQLVNPVAPAEYGQGEQSVTRDVTTGKIDGIKLFSFSLKPREKRAPKVTVKTAPAPEKPAPKPAPAAK
ncbi:MAG: hypothetical protein AB1705_24975 [Verrucomicrobiota bacterium]